MDDSPYQLNQFEPNLQRLIDKIESQRGAF